MNSTPAPSTLPSAMGHTCETTLRVRYAETDQMGMAYHGNYFAWFEVGRTEFLRELGFDYRSLESEEGCYIVVADASCRYKAPARYDDLLRIRTELRKIRGPVLRFGYEVLREADGALLAEGETAHIVADKQMKMRTLPEKYLQALAGTVAEARE
ncbi:MAG TPA: thioesterase family protein [Candidatus Acidoferrales bacterium]|nr:thioesterase family protein [Candidatus Acidoferrales bacterium]